MNRSPLFLEPIFQERIWGGTKLKELYHYDIPSAKTGECWAIAAHPNGQSTIKNGELAGLTMGELWENKRELFGNLSGDRFPLLTKIIDANEPLSVQVHPDDRFAQEFEYGELGKTECWYIIDCVEGAEIIYGHHAQTKEEFSRMMSAGEWDQLLRKVKVKPGDFFFVPSGTIHAIGAGILILETQQNSDTTYRVYDYGRKDSKGQTRELHVEKALAVTTMDAKQERIIPQIERGNGADMYLYVDTEFFSVMKIKVHERTELRQEHLFMLGSVIDGVGLLKHDQREYPVKKGDHFLLPYDCGLSEIVGKVEVIFSYLKKHTVNSA